MTNDGLMQALLAKGVTVLQLGISLLAFAGDSIFRALDIPPPAVYVQYRERKMGVVLGTWIVGNLIQNTLTQTGAFEVYSSGELVSFCPLGRLNTQLAVNVSKD